MLCQQQDVTAGESLLNCNQTCQETAADPSDTGEFTWMRCTIVPFRGVPWQRSPCSVASQGWARASIAVGRASRSLQIHSLLQSEKHQGKVTQGHVLHMTAQCLPSQQVLTQAPWPMDSDIDGCSLGGKTTLSCMHSDMPMLFSE